MARRLSFGELYDRVAQLRQALARTASAKATASPAMSPTCRRPSSAMLAAASLGAIWSSCSPDFGVQGVLDRFGQIEPKVLIAADGYFYNGKAHRLPRKAARDPAADCRRCEASS